MSPSQRTARHEAIATRGTAWAVATCGDVAPAPRVKAALRALALLLALWGACGSAAAVECGAVQSAGKRYTVCRVDVARERLQLFLGDESGQPFRHFDPLTLWLAARGQTLAFAMNAGMFHPGFAPVGLYVDAGKQGAPLNTDAGRGNFFLQPNGVFFISAAGAAVAETSEYARLGKPVSLATQSGPLLLRRGVIHPAFIPASESRLIRNGVGVATPGTAVFAISEDPVNFHEFALFFRDVLGCPDALYLDGNISSLYAPQLQRNDLRADLGPIIGVVQ